ncbi:hypothetical protein [Streptomyces sp. NPDC051218]|uniref:hypothetical protein n=1 Tax=Streptomyces sp. NPDC051218 TaxID=3365645 RepID=UPI0037950EDB
MKELSVRGTVPLMFVVASVLAVTACSASAAPQAPLGDTALRDALPTADALPRFKATAQKAPLLEKQDIVTADKAACRPIADMMNVRPKHPRKALVWATLDGADTAEGGSLALSSFAGDGADAWMSELKVARTDCTEFTATSKRGWSFRFTVEPSLPSRRATTRSRTS